MEPWVFPTAPGSKVLLNRFILVSWVLARVILENLYKMIYYYVPKLWDYFLLQAFKESTGVSREQILQGMVCTHYLASR